MIRTGLIVSSAVITAMTAITLWTVGQLPAENIPVHWGLDGQPDRWADKGEAQIIMWILPGVAAFTTLVLALAPSLEPMQQNLHKSRKAYVTVWVAVMLLLLAVSAGVSMLMLRSIQGETSSNEFVRFIIAATGILFIVQGNFLPKTRQNFFLGIRTPWTLSSAYVWERTHRFAGRAFILAGFVCLIGAFTLSGPQLLIMLLVTLGGTFLASITYSYLAWCRADDKNTGHDLLV